VRSVRRLICATGQYESGHRAMIHFYDSATAMPWSHVTAHTHIVAFRDSDFDHNFATRHRVGAHCGIGRWNPTSGCSWTGICRADAQHNKKWDVFHFLFLSNSSSLGGLKRLERSLSRLNYTMHIESIRDGRAFGVWIFGKPNAWSSTFVQVGTIAHVLS
jgi:hypothetical protein